MTTAEPAPPKSGSRRHLVMVLTNMSMAAALFLAIPLILARMDDLPRMPWILAIGLLIVLNLAAVVVSMIGMVAPIEASDAFGEGAPPPTTGKS